MRNNTTLTEYDMINPDGSIIPRGDPPDEIRALFDAWDSKDPTLVHHISIAIIRSNECEALYLDPPGF